MCVILVLCMSLRLSSPTPWPLGIIKIALLTLSESYPKHDAGDHDPGHPTPIPSHPGRKHVVRPGSSLKAEPKQGALAGLYK